MALTGDESCEAGWTAKASTPDATTRRVHLERSCIVVVSLCVVCWLCEVGGCERAAGATAPDAGAGAGHRRLTTSAPERSCLAGLESAAAAYHRRFRKAACSPCSSMFLFSSAPIAARCNRRLRCAQRL